MGQALHSDMDIALERWEKETETLKKVERRSTEQRAGNIVITCFGKRLYSYFQKWKDSKAAYRHLVDKKLKDKIYFLYKARIQSYFLHWRKNSAKKKIAKKKMVIQQFEEETHTLERNSIEDNRRLNSRREAVASMSQKKNTKVLKKFILRKQKLVILKWASAVNAHKVAKDH
jgi:hypothetical protein